MDPWLLGGLQTVSPYLAPFLRNNLDLSPKDYYYDLNDRRCHVALTTFENSTAPCEGYTPRGDVLVVEL